MIFDNGQNIAVEGELQAWHSLGESGMEKTQSFCPNCGSPVFVKLALHPDNIIIHTGSLDDPSVFAPDCVVYAECAQPWDRIDPDLQRFEKLVVR